MADFLSNASLQEVAGLVYSVLLLELILMLQYRALSVLDLSSVQLPYYRLWLGRKKVGSFSLQHLDCAECKMHRFVALY